MITLRPSTWWFLAGAFGLCLFMVCVVIFSETLELLYLRETEGRRLQREFGFIAGEVRSSPESDQMVFAITAVEPNGAFARAGVLLGDRPWDYHGRSELAFYFILQAARHREVILRVSRVAPAGEFPQMVKIPISLQKQPQPNSALQPTSARHELRFLHVPRVGRSG